MAATDLTETIPSARHPRSVLVLGATGYIGGRLVPRLLQAGHAVSVGVRSPDKLSAVPWADEVTVHTVDLDDGTGLKAAMEGIDDVCYLVHSMNSGRDFERHEAQAATRLVEATAAAGGRQIIYLGGLHPESAKLSMHMRSRAKVGEIFLASSTPAIVFQAGIIIGSGSASFEMIRHLADALRWMPAPDWVANRVEPLSVRDVLYYLVAACDLPKPVNRAFDIGSGDVLTYAEVMKDFARIRDLPPRHVIALPLPAPTLSGIWVGLVTPLPFALTLPLVQSLQEDAVTRNDDIDAVIPPPSSGLLSYDQAVRLALRREKEGAVATNWDADSGELEQAAKPLPNDPQWAGKKAFVDDRRRLLRDLAVSDIWPVIVSIGGRNGWYSWPLAWKIRGLWDKIVGGAGLNRGRRLPDALRVGDPVDWWRVEEIVPDHKLLLRAEMKVSGDAWLEFTVDQVGPDCEYRQRAIFFPRGIRGRLYWAFVSPFHRFIFPAMACNIERAARRNERRRR